MHQLRCVPRVLRQINQTAAGTTLGDSNLARVLHELLPLRLELFPGDHVNFPVLVVVGDEKAALGKVRQDRLHHDYRSTCVQLLVHFGLIQITSSSPMMLTIIIATVSGVSVTITIEIRTDGAPTCLV